jgi:hypothetical protein
MNGFTFTTKSGTVYEINRDAMTWMRVSTTRNSGPIRNAKGNLISAPVVKIGQPVFLEDDAVLPGHVAHYVQTSPVISISEIIT